MPYLDFPLHFDGTGRTAATDLDGHIRDLIEQVLLTAPGERVMRPTFGAGLLTLVFEPNGATLAATTQFLVQSALQQHLSHLIAPKEVTVEAIESTLQVTVRFTVLSEAVDRTASFTVAGGAP
jgi:phage baseplate assembly protein W